MTKMNFMTKFKIGDEVRIIEVYNPNGSISTDGVLRANIGKSGKITMIKNSRQTPYEIGGIRYDWSESELRPVKRKKIWV